MTDHTDVAQTRTASTVEAGRRAATRTPNVLRPRVVLVDDHRAIRAAVGRLLSDACDIVGEIASGLQAVDSAKVLRPDVVVLDLNLPDTNGFDVCQQLVRTCPGVRVVILTALVDPDVEREAYRRGAAAFVRKGQAADLLLPAIERLCFDRLPRRGA